MNKKSTSKLPVKLIAPRRNAHDSSLIFSLHKEVSSKNSKTGDFKHSIFSFNFYKPPRAFAPSVGQVNVSKPLSEDVFKKEMRKSKFLSFLINTLSLIASFVHTPPP